MINGAQKTGGTMALSNSQHESIMRVYNRTQLQKKHELDARVDEVYEKIPAVREMNDADRRRGGQRARKSFGGRCGRGETFARDNRRPERAAPGADERLRLSGGLSGDAV